MQRIKFQKMEWLLSQKNMTHHPVDQVWSVVSIHTHTTSYMFKGQTEVVMNGRPLACD